MPRSRTATTPLLLVGCCIALLSACGGGKATATPPAAATTAATVPPRAASVTATTPAPTTVVPTALPTTALPTATAGVTAQPVATASNPAPTTQRTAAPGAVALPTGPPQAHTLPDGTIMLPAGFNIDVYAQNVGQARFMAVRPSDGMLFVADQGGRILILPDANHDGKADNTVVFASNLRQPSSIAFYQDWVYVGETDKVSRFRAPNNAMQPQGDKEVIIPNLPTGGHATRTVAFGPDGRLYLAIGSSCNVCNEKDDRRAAIGIYDPDGKNGRLFATGLRNAVGFTWQSGTNQMWATVNGRDSIGDDLPPDDLRRINDGTSYGWPYCYNGPNPNPEYKDAAKCANVPPDDVPLQAHSAALGLTFGDAFAAPQPYKDSIYIAFHGSWNRSVKTGYKVVRVPIVNGQPGKPEDFAWGWLPGSADDPGQVWGRPVGVTVGSDGALYITDDSKGRVYRITATG
ncbi:MAG: PQQ-dependent sugar dehydrogenase [Chloroflexota bacterium]|nr:PQQ-dependent sugar dehydrogenase [Chloroflexota bacterium]